MDPFSRKIVGWAAQPTIWRELVLDAALMAVRRGKPRGAVIHSDQGTQYGCDAWRRFFRSNQLEPSMSRKGNCWDNAVAGSFFSSLKKERIKKQIYKNRHLALADVADYIDAFCNRTRRRDLQLAYLLFQRANVVNHQECSAVLGSSRLNRGGLLVQSTLSETSLVPIMIKSHNRITVFPSRHLHAWRSCRHSRHSQTKYLRPLAQYFLN